MGDAIPNRNLVLGWIVHSNDPTYVGSNSEKILARGNEQRRDTRKGRR